MNEQEKRDLVHRARWTGLIVGVGASVAIWRLGLPVWAAELIGLGIFGAVIYDVILTAGGLRDRM